MLELIRYLHCALIC